MAEKQSGMTKKEFFLDYLLSIVLEIVILFLLMLFFGLFINKGELLQEVKLVGDEMASPKTGRLVYTVLAFVLAVGTCLAASKFAKKEKEVPAFWLGYASGIFFWQALGEGAWHFSVGGVNFVQLESIASFPLVLLFIGLIIYGAAHRSFDWGVWCVIISFACNWLGHYVTIGIYPFFEELVEAHTWNIWAGAVAGGIMLIYSIIYLITRGGTKKGRLFASMLTYIALGCTALSIMEG